MKKYEMKSVIDGLKAIKLPKLEDKAMSTTLFKVFMLLCGKQRQYEEAQKDMQELFLSEHKEEQEKVQKLQSDFNLENDAKKRTEIAKEINSYEDYLNAVKELNEKMEALGKEDIEVEQIDAEKFQEAYAKQEVDLGVVEKIYPLLKV